MAVENAASLDLTSLATNVGVGLGLAGAALAGIWKSVKKIKEALPADDASPTKVVGGMIADHTTILMWTESNRTAGEAMGDLEKEVRELRFAVTQLKDKIK